MVPLPWLSVAVPISFPLFLNVSEPVATEGVTAPLRVTYLCPPSKLTVAVVTVVVEAALTTCVNTLEVLATKPDVPAYSAVRECDPAESSGTERDVVPPTIDAVPSVLDPSLNVTVPLFGAGPKTGTIDAVRVSEPNVEGFWEEYSNVVVLTGAAVTVTETGVALLPLKFPFAP
jgi:hypothetical protein